MFGRTAMTITLVSLLTTACADRKSGPGAVPPKTNQGLTCAAKFSSGACVSVAWEKSPTTKGPAAFSFTLFNEYKDSGKPTRLDWTGPVAVVPWMPSMGHGVEEEVSVTKLGEGQYRASNVTFSMRGKWELRILLKDGDLIKDEATLPLTL